MICRGGVVGFSPFRQFCITAGVAEAAVPRHLNHSSCDPSAHRSRPFGSKRPKGAEPATLLLDDDAPRGGMGVPRMARSGEFFCFGSQVFSDKTHTHQPVAVQQHRLSVSAGASRRPLTLPGHSQSCRSSLQAIPRLTQLAHPPRGSRSGQREP